MSRAINGFRLSLHDVADLPRYAAFEAAYRPEFRVPLRRFLCDVGLGPR